MTRFLEKEGYDVVYSTNIDTHTSGDQLKKYYGVVIAGHDEYWTKSMRDAIQGARDAGVNLGFFGANTGYWQIRMEPSKAAADANRTIVSYKFSTGIFADPIIATDPTQATVTFRDPLVNRPEAALVGVTFAFDPAAAYLDMVISNCIPLICANTSLVNGSRLANMLGYEVDAIDPVASPANIQVITNSPYIFVDDFGVSATRYSNMTYYKAASGAGVFATGSMNWNYGLNAYSVNQSFLNPDVQQVTRNVLNSFVPYPPQTFATSKAPRKVLKARGSR